MLIGRTALEVNNILEGEWNKKNGVEKKRWIRVKSKKGKREKEE